MSLKKYVSIFQRINYLVEMQATGTPQEFALKLGVSERQLFNYLKDLRDLGYEFQYSSILGSYYFQSTKILSK